MAGAAPVDFLSSEDWGRENYVLAFANKLPLTLVADPSLVKAQEMERERN